MDPRQKLQFWIKPTGYAASHCSNCKYGWKRSSEEGSIIVCLLDRESVPAKLNDCDRYEPRSDEAGSPA